MQSAGNVGYLLLTIGECYSAPETPLSAEEEMEFGQLILRKIIKNDMTLVATSNKQQATMRFSELQSKKA